MSKKLIYSVAIVAIIALIATCLTGITVSNLGFANAANLAVEATGVSITRSVDVMTVGQISQFAAEITYTSEEGDIAPEVTWTSSNSDVATVDANGVVKAIAIGTTTIEATYEEFSASINLSVQASTNAMAGLHLNKYMYALKSGDSFVLSATYPSDVTLALTSDNEDVIYIEDGEVYGVEVGTATVTATATTEEGVLSAKCLFTVLPSDEAVLNDFSSGEATSSITFNAVGSSTGLIASLPEGFVAETYAWNSLYPEVARVYEGEDTQNCTVTATGFGSTIITMIATDADGNQCGAYCEVLVKDGTFFITGLQNDWINLPNEGWNLTETGTNSNVYTITTALWATSGFQLIHAGIDQAWTTKLTPTSYNESQSTNEYVENNETEFMARYYGIYTVTLDLNQGPAKVAIVMNNLYTTDVALAITSEAEYLQEADNTVTIGITPLPEGALYNPNALSAVVGTIKDIPEGETVEVTAEIVEGALEATVTLKDTYTGQYALLAPITIHIGQAYSEIDIVILPEGREPVRVSTLTFENAPYSINVNNGVEAAWTVPIKASVDADATIQQVEYIVDNPNCYVDVDEDGNTYFVAGALGTYTLQARSLGTNAEGEHVTATTTVYVYSDAMYLIGTLNGTTPNNWTALDPSYRSLDGTPFENWALTYDEEARTYSTEKVLNQFDVFSIVFLGMTGNWNGAFTYDQLNIEESSMDYLSRNSVNVQVNRSAVYRITLDLNSEYPTFTVEYIEDAEPIVNLNLYFYVLRAGGAWDGNTTDYGNVLVESENYITTNTADSYTLTVSYDFSKLVEAGAWPTIQFVTATGQTDGYFENATWYNGDVTIPTITGNAFAEENAENQFTNGGSGCQLWFEGVYPADFNVTFTVTFDRQGNITNIHMEYGLPSAD